ASKAKPMLVLMLSGHALDVPRTEPSNRTQAMEAFRRDLLEDAIPLVEQHYRVLPEREHRAITGLSMGAAQSLTIRLNPRAHSRHQSLDLAQIHHEWHVTEGDHSWPVWRNHLVDFAPRLFQP